jgi:hypothetical protein
MEKTKALNVLKKYKDELPFDYNILYDKFLNGDINTLTYISWLIKHDNFINERNYRKPMVRLFKLHDRHDDIEIPDRINFLKISETCTYFDGSY